jgi:hypothetical protein
MISGPISNPPGWNVYSFLKTFDRAAVSYNTMASVSLNFLIVSLTTITKMNVQIPGHGDELTSYVIFLWGLATFR